jgi:antitoxin component of MazEF toxin-antitoxin module
MRKEIKKYGNSRVLVLTQDDLKVYGLETGDIIELVITKVNHNIT